MTSRPASRAIGESPVTAPLVGSLNGGQGCGHLGLRGGLVDAEPAEDAFAVLQFQQGEQDVLGPDVVVAQAKGLAEGEFQHLAHLLVDRDQGRHLAPGNATPGSCGGSLRVSGRPAG